MLFGTFIFIWFWIVRDWCGERIEAPQPAPLSFVSLSINPIAIPPYEYLRVNCFHFPSIMIPVREFSELLITARMFLSCCKTEKFVKFISNMLVVY